VAMRRKRSYCFVSVEVFSVTLLPGAFVTLVELSFFTSSLGAGAGAAGLITVVLFSTFFPPSAGGATTVVLWSAGGLQAVSSAATATMLKMAFIRLVGASCRALRDTADWGANGSGLVRGGRGRRRRVVGLHGGASRQDERGGREQGKGEVFHLRDTWLAWVFGIGVSQLAAQWSRASSSGGGYLVVVVVVLDFFSSITGAAGAVVVVVLRSTAAPPLVVVEELRSEAPPLEVVVVRL
jgi:hypothetical protein